MKKWSCVALFALILLVVLALSSCGGETPDTTDAETVDDHTHTYETRVVEPTCSEGGFTVYTCTECGNKYTDDKKPATGECVYERRQMIPSEKTSAYGIDAAYFDADVCSGCGDMIVYAAVLSELTFDGEPEAPFDYVPSENYQAAIATIPDCLVALGLEGEEAAAREANWLKMLDFIDQQKYLDAWFSSSGVRGAYLQDGALVGDWQFFVLDNLSLFSEQPVYERFSVSFDLAVNGNLKKGSVNDFAAIFGTGGSSSENGNESMWRNPWRLCLNSTPSADGKHELVCAYWTYAAGVGTRYVVPTGMYIEKGKTYSYRLDFDYGAKEEDAYPTFRLFVKEVDAEEYTDLGEYTYVPRPRTSSFKFFDPNCADGNILDNFKVFVDLVED